MRKWVAIGCMVITMGVAAETNWHLTKHDVTGVYDGDTFHISLKGLPEVFGEHLPIRVKSIDTPEIRSQCDNPTAKEREERLARRAKAYLIQLINGSKSIDILNVTRDSRGKYFRIVADPLIDGVPLHQLMLDSGLGKPMQETRFNWCTYVLSTEAVLSEDELK